MDTQQIGAHAQASELLVELRRLAQVDRLLGGLLRHPRLLQLGAVLLAAALVILSLHQLSKVVPAMQTTGDVSHIPAASPAEQAVLEVVVAYNQASIAAAMLDTTEPMRPYLTADSRAWTAAHAEYLRRQARAETHRPTLVGWGVLSLHIDGDSAVVETQEQWDDRTSVGDQVVASRRGIVTRNSYRLRRTAGDNRWLIDQVTTTTIIG